MYSLYKGYKHSDINKGQYTVYIQDISPVISIKGNIQFIYKT